MSMTSPRILVLDDDDAVRESLLYYFDDLGWDVREATTAEDALALVQVRPPEGMIVDIRLPGMDGNNFILELCKTNPYIACVICTGSPEYEPPERVRSLPQVFEKVYPKPVKDLRELADSLLEQISRCKERMKSGKP